MASKKIYDEDDASHLNKFVLEVNVLRVLSRIRHFEMHDIVPFQRVFPSTNLRVTGEAPSLLSHPFNMSCAIKLVKEFFLAAGAIPLSQMIL